MRIIYSFAIWLFETAISIAASFSQKAAKAKAGRREQNVEEQNSCIWVHCASHGEFEMILPVIQKLKENTDIPLVLTFFSPSGVEHANAHKVVDAVYYMPIDRTSKMTAFLDRINPLAAIFVKAEFWYNTFSLLEKRSVPYVLASSTFDAGQFFFRPPMSWFRSRLKRASQIFAQDHNSLEVLLSHDFDNAVFGGNPRLERVLQITDERYENQRVQAFIGDSKLMIVGSSWEKEEQLIEKVLDQYQGLKVVLAPHDVSMHRISNLQERFGESMVLLSQDLQNSQQRRILVIDQIGILSRLYRYADLAMVGGGFRRKGLHNTLEPCAYHIPVIVGPHYRDFPESQELVSLSLMRSINDEDELKDAIAAALDPSESHRIQEGLKDYFVKNQGATEKISTFILTLIRRKMN